MIHALDRELSHREGPGPVTVSKGSEVTALLGLLEVGEVQFFQFKGNAVPFVKEGVEIVLTALDPKYAQTHPPGKAE
jgi:hypothetical protein